MSELRFQDVSVRFGTRRRGMTAVDRVNLMVPDGEVVGLVGESGSGKSTLARAAAGLTPVTGGHILLDGTPLRHNRGPSPVQMVFQDPNSSLDPRMTIGDSIAEAIPRGTKGIDRRREVGRLLEMVELDGGRASSYPGQLSGGQRQRVALARALAANPRVIIADEITSALDVSTQATVLNLVGDLQREIGTSMLFISHNLAVVRYVATTIAVMYLGRIIEHGPAEQVLGDPQHPYTHDLLSAIPDSRPLQQRTPLAPFHEVSGTSAASLRGSDPEPSRSDVSPSAVLMAEPADPHAPPPGCRYHPRCPRGPLVREDRDVCRTVEPSTDHLHSAACHFAPAPNLEGASCEPVDAHR